MRGGEEKMSLHLVVMDTPRTQAGPEEDRSHSGVITALSEGQGFSLAKPEERLGTWYQVFHGGQKARAKTGALEE